MKQERTADNVIKELRSIAAELAQVRRSMDDAFLAERLTICADLLEAERFEEQEATQ